MCALAATTVAVALQSEEAMEREEVEDLESESGEILSDGCCHASYKLLQLLTDAMRAQQADKRPNLAMLLEGEPSGHLPASAVQVPSFFLPPTSCFPHPTYHLSTTSSPRPSRCALVASRVC